MANTYDEFLNYRETHTHKPFSFIVFPYFMCTRPIHIYYSPLERSSQDGQEESFARTVYLHFTFVDNPGIVHYLVVEL